MRVPNPLRRGDQAIADSATTNPAGGTGGPSSTDLELPGGSTFPDLHAELTRHQALSPAHVDTVRFAIASQGYHFPQVDQFVQQVHETLTTLYALIDQAVRSGHSLSTELAQSVFDNQRLRADIALFQVQGDPLVHADGSYVRESDLDTTEAMQQIEALNEALREARESATTNQTEADHYRSTAAALQEEVESWRAWGNQVSQETETARATIEHLQAEVHRLSQATVNTETQPSGAPGSDEAAQDAGPATDDIEATSSGLADDSYSPTQAGEDAAELMAHALTDDRADLNTLRAAIGEETDADGSLWRDERHHAEVAGTVAHEAQAGIGVTSPVTSPPYETELPAGVSVVPDEDSLDFTEHYPETREGLPINNGEVPLDMWAPEIAMSKQQG